MVKSAQSQTVVFRKFAGRTSSCSAIRCYGCRNPCFNGLMVCYNVQNMFWAGFVPLCHAFWLLFSFLVIFYLFQI